MGNLPNHAVFDGHNDVISRIWRDDEGAVGRFFTGEGKGHIDISRARKGGLGGGLCAIYVPSERTEDAKGNLPTPPRDLASDVTMQQAGLLLRLGREGKDSFQLCHSAAEIRSAMEAGRFAAVMHIEGVEAFGPDLDLLYLLHEAGLRSLGPVWSRPNIFAHGVPFRFPSSPDIGPGLTNAGKDLVRVCNDLRVMLDLSHLNEAGFWDVAKLSDAPLVASHSGVHALCAHSRNLTDRQLDAIRDSGGLVGINFGVIFLHAESKRDTGLPLSVLVQHVDYVVQRIGIDHVALGSDFDGTTIPDAIGDAAGLPALIRALEDAGYQGADLAKITHGNWLRVLGETWGG